jgi:hypothetical protein
MSQIFDDIFFVIYILYYIDQISSLEIRVGLINWEGESKISLSESVDAWSRMEGWWC